jgi:hypothetical protein
MSKPVALALASLVLLGRPAFADTTLAAAAAGAAQIRHESTAVKVYTNRDLPAVVPVAPREAALPPASAGPIEQGEAYWRGRMQALRTKLAVDVGDAHINRLNLVNLQARAQATIIYLTVFGPEILRLHDEVTHWTAVVEEDYAAIAALEEEGRRAGALPGWLR